MLDMHNYIFILCMHSVFLQNIFMLLDISIFPYLFPKVEITSIDLWRHDEHSIAQINISVHNICVT